MKSKHFSTKLPLTTRRTSRWQSISAQGSLGRFQKKLSKCPEPSLSGKQKWRLFMTFLDKCTPNFRADSITRISVVIPIHVERKMRYIEWKLWVIYFIVFLYFILFSEKLTFKTSNFLQFSIPIFLWIKWNLFYRKWLTVVFTIHREHKRKWNTNFIFIATVFEYSLDDP